MQGGVLAGILEQKKKIGEIWLKSGVWDFLGKNTEAGCHFLLHGIFLTQGSNPSLRWLLHWRRILFTEQPGNPSKLGEKDIKKERKEERKVLPTRSRNLGGGCISGSMGKGWSGIADPVETLGQVRVKPLGLYLMVVGEPLKVTECSLTSRVWLISEWLSQSHPVQLTQAPFYPPLPKVPSFHELFILCL